ncbi:hypothetical protein HN937_28260 [Candidatus Poribacteria bacterium]|jgi:hypothetical protein|nr:hypothetical protein [Candidatus Poribacteria bacterium]
MNTQTTNAKPWDALSGFHPDLPRPRFGLSCYMMSDGETAMAFVAADGTGALVGSDTDAVVFWGQRGELHGRWEDLPNEALAYRSVWNVADRAESVVRMARRALADYRASLLETKDPREALWLRAA